MENFLKKAVLFLVKFGIIFGILHYLLLVGNILFFQEWLAKTIGNLLQLNVQNEVISLGIYSLVVSPSCTGLVSSIILAGIVFSLKKPELKTKFKIVLLSAIVFLIVNFFRVFLVVWTAKMLGFQYAEALHQLTWFAMSGIILVLWYGWMKKTVGIRNFGELI